MNIPHVSQRAANIERFLFSLFFLEYVFDGPDLSSQEMVDETSCLFDFIIYMRMVLDCFAADLTRKNLRVDTQYLDPDIRWARRAL